MGKEKSGEGFSPPFVKHVKRTLFLWLFFFRIALFADLLGLGGFNAALVCAFLARLLRVVTATGLNICRPDYERKSANK